MKGRCGDLGRRKRTVLRRGIPFAAVSESDQTPVSILPSVNMMDELVLRPFPHAHGVALHLFAQNLTAGRR